MNHSYWSYVHQLNYRTGPHIAGTWTGRLVPKIPRREMGVGLGAIDLTLFDGGRA